MMSDELRRLQEENDRLKTVMVAAAEEIHAHWDAHCDAEGYGPANLMDRLERGIASSYSYRAGDFARLQAENDRCRSVLVETAEGWRELETAAQVALQALKRAIETTTDVETLALCEGAVQKLKEAME